MTVIQDGLAVFEIGLSVLQSIRLKSLNNWAQANTQTDEGTDFKGIFAFSLNEGFEPEDSNRLSRQGFRGRKESNEMAPYISTHIYRSDGAVILVRFLPIYGLDDL